MYLRRWCQQASPWAIGSQGTFSPIVHIIISTSYSTACTKTLKMADINFSFKDKRKNYRCKILGEANNHCANNLVSKRASKIPRETIRARICLLQKGGRKRL